MENNNARVSETISIIRFPLIVLIVLIHCQFSNIQVGEDTFVFSLDKYPLYSNVSYFFSKYICAIGVPLFGLLSGFLYFYKVDEFSIGLFRNKTKRRIKSLVIPYFAWNIMVFLFYLAGQSLMPSMGGDRLLITDYTWLDYLNVFWGIDDGCPMCFQFWFIRDLIIVSLICPLIYYIARLGGGILIYALLVLWFFDIKIPIPGLNSSVITFFSVGAYLSLNKITEKRIPHSLFTIVSILYAVFLIIEIVLYNTNYSDTIVFHFLFKTGVLTGILAFPLAFYFYYKRPTNSFLEKSSFFVYAAHGVFVSIFTRVLLKTLPICYDLVALLTYFLIPALSIGICLVVFKILRKFLPGFTSIITGGKV